MNRIAAHLSGFEVQLLHRLAEANAAAQINSLRLTTGEKINSPADDPAAFLELSGLQNQLGAVNDTIDQVGAASSIGAQAQLTLDLVSTELTTIRTALAADEDRTLTAQQRATNQATIDASLTEINRLSRTDISGRSILDGSTDFRSSGVNRAQVRDLQVYAIRGASTTISGTVTQAAAQATLTYTGSGGQATDAATFTLTGMLGSTTVTVAQNDNLTDVADDINQYSHNTGVTASVAGDVLTFTTVETGAGATITVNVTSGTFNVAGGNGDGTAQGVNAQATINGRTLSGDDRHGNRVTFNQNGVHFDVEFESGFSGAFDTVTVSGDSTLTFALSTDPAYTSTLAIPGVQTARLGGLSGTLDQLAGGGALAGLDGNTSQAIRVVDEAIAELTLIQGRVDGFTDETVASSSSLLTGLQTEIQNAISDVNAVDTTEESQLLAQNQALAANAVASLSILSQQRSSLVNVLTHLAGLD